MRILLVEDDPMIGKTLQQALQQDGYAVDWAPDGEAARTALATGRDAYALVLLDLGLPRKSGLDLLKELRRAGNRVRVLVVTARDAIADRVAGLDAGADDYLTKPFGAGELLARIRAALRRVGPQEGGPIFATDGLTVDLVGRSVRLGGQEVQLTPTEYSLLKAFVIHANKLLTHRQLVREVWGGAHYEDTQHLLRVNISNLRRKLEADPTRPHYIITEPGVGYRLRTESRVSSAPSNV